MPLTAAVGTPWPDDANNRGLDATPDQRPTLHRSSGVQPQGMASQLLDAGADARNGGLNSDSSVPRSADGNSTVDGALSSGSDMCVSPKPIFIISDCTGESECACVCLYRRTGGMGRGWQRWTCNKQQEARHGVFHACMHARGESSFNLLFVYRMMMMMMMWYR